MCGIAGIMTFDGAPVVHGAIRRMTDAIAHRGPDGEGFHLEGPLGLGHRRLAILDLTDAGRQPLSYADGRYWITYNGEIYNFIEIRRDLEDKGYRFRTDTDTEVILASYDRWGLDCLLRFNGMWAFAIWDGAERRLFLARDRFGVKPLYYMQTPERFTFASEIKAILKTRSTRPDPNPQVLCDVLSGGSADLCEETLYKGIFQMPAGSWMRVDATGEVRKGKWWETLDHLPVVPDEEAEQVERYRELFTDAVRIRLRSDVPVGSLLSGGMDSSSIVCTIHRHRDDPHWHGGDQRLAADWQRTFTAEYPGLSVDESDYARAVLDATGIAGSCIRPSPEKIGDFIAHMVAQQDVPVDQSLFAVHSVYKAVGESGLKVTLDGQGADEALCGYSAIPAACQYLRDFKFFDTLEALKCQSALLGGREGIAKAAWAMALQGVSNHSRPGRRFRRLFRWPYPSGAPSLALLEHAHPDQAASPSKKLDYLGRILYAQVHRAPLPPILRRFDHAAMAYSVESRMPFMDYRLVTYTLALPTAQKVGGGYTKVILRRAMRGIVPELVLGRRAKFGFPTPPEWFAAPVTQVWCREVISTSSFRKSVYWDGGRFARWFEEKSRSSSWSIGDANTVFNVLSTHIWLSN